MKNSKYTKEILEPIVKDSINYRDILRKLNLSFSGGSHMHLKKIILSHNIDTSHFLGCKSYAGNRNDYIMKIKRIPSEELLAYNTAKKTITTGQLKRALIENNIECKCFKCGITDWLNKPIVLQIHHIDGDKFNNNLINLQYLCPNCHVQTDNWGKKSRI